MVRQGSPERSRRAHHERITFNCPTLSLLGISVLPTLTILGFHT
ncbi:hypothetical protein CRENPOLYSF2_830004 [Crenothrix polyspora]|uniref:Uncharacterized protein n=1 Tax=Crenothrix polyspora TaxID=360316 RepID=A0A1R4HJF5_9GAMM|nr:hypothetical protein CRENPOLYSF2_830004 [Crenothrix polyspora]